MDKVTLKSKKFVAYLLGELGWKFTIGAVLWRNAGEIDFYVLTLLMTIIIISGFLQVGYILGQASLDKYVQVSGQLLDRDNNKDGE